MKNQTKEEKQELEEKLKQIKLDIDNLPNIFKIKEKVRYKPLKEYDTSTYKTYHFIDIQDIEIYLTKATRLEDVDKKYKTAIPLFYYLQPDKEDVIENYLDFLNMLKNLDLNKMEEIEKEQKQYQKQIPYEIKYKDNFIWEIYYSDIDNKYFMMFPTNETQVEALFYLIKKKIELQKSKKKETIFVPINNMEYTSGILKKSEISDLENYLWYFTNNWPSIYEIHEKDKTKSIQILGKVQIYDRLKSIYKMKFNSKEEAQKQFKLIKALFILKSHAEEEYPFKIGLNNEGELNFYLNHNNITYEGLSEFIKNEIDKKSERIRKIIEQNLLETERWILLKQTVEKQNLEYIAKEKQIVTFLECKKTFFGRVSYFFKSKKRKINQEIEKEEDLKQKEVEQEKIELEQKQFYTIEDLLKVCTILEEKEKKLKNKQMDIKALENKKENLQRKIQNATLYINEIESHRKSIFDFWKFTNKDEVPLLIQGEIEEKQKKQNKISKAFSYEEDIEDLGKEVDRKQRKIFSEKECDAIFAIYEDVEAFNIDRKQKKLKKDEKYLEKSLKEKQKEYEENIEIIQEKDFDIFGNVVEDKTKIKLLNNKKHREIEKSKYKILDIHPNTTIEEYKDNIHHYQNLLKEAYEKSIASYDLPIYLVSNETIENKEWVIMDMNVRKAIQKYKKSEDTFILNRINLKEGIQAIFYTNTMFYDNFNKTLPEGMDITTEVLFDLKKYEIKLVGRKDFNMNFLENKFDYKVKKVEVYEYDLERR